MNNFDSNRLNKQLRQISEDSGVSLVAYYGDKPLELEQLIQELQQLLNQTFFSNFFPYELPQVHATIIGCEGLRTELGIVNKWFYRLRSEIRYINFSGLLNYFLNTKNLPLNICFGGYQPDINYQFLSRERHPSDRSFQLQSLNNTIVPITIGWSFQNKIITNRLDSLRRDLQQFNCLHKYHKSPQDTDNDLYFRLGTIKTDFQGIEITDVRQKINCYLKNRDPIKIALSQENLSIIKYQDLTVPISTTEVYTLSKLNNNPSSIPKLYE